MPEPQPPHRIPDPTLMARLQLSVKGVDWAASRGAPWQHLQLDGEWSAHQHLFHLLDNERVFQERIRRMVAEERPVLVRYDSEAFMEREYDPAEDVEVVAGRFVAARGATYESFQALTDEQWARRAVWPDGREVDLDWLAEKVLWHALAHFAALLDIHGEYAPLQSTTPPA